MTLKDLISSNCWLNVELKMKELNFDRSIEGLSSVYDKLCTTAAVESDIFINIEEKKDSDSSWFEVFGKKSIKDLDYNATFALEFTPWEEWLGMEIDTNTLYKFDDLEIICRCLLEMTFISLDEEEIKKEINLIDSRIQTMFDSDFDESNFVSWEAVKEMLESFKDDQEEEKE